MPRRPDNSVSLATLRTLLRCLAERGLDMEDFHQRLMLPHPARQDPDARISAELMGRAWELAYLLTGDPALALSVGASGHSSAFGTFGYLINHSETLEEAMHAACRYFLIISGGLRLELMREGAYQTLIASNDGTPPSAWQLSVERTFASVMSILRQEVPTSGVSVRAEFSFPRPTYAEAYARHIGPNCRFNAGRDCLSFDSELLSSPLSQSHPRLKQIFTAEAEHLLGSLGQEHSTAQALRALVPALMATGQCSAATAAGKLGLSERTLQRRLAGEDVSFQQILDEVRKDRCLLLFRDASLSTEQIAFSCGFSEPSSFFRAFRRWTGRTPAAYRAEL